MKKRIFSVVALGALLLQVIGGASEAKSPVGCTTLPCEVCVYQVGSPPFYVDYNGPWFDVSNVLMVAFEARTANFLHARKTSTYCPREWVFQKIYGALHACAKKSQHCETLLAPLSLPQSFSESGISAEIEAKITLSVLAEGAFKESQLCDEEEQECPLLPYTTMLEDLMPSGYVLSRNGSLLFYKVAAYDWLLEQERNMGLNK